MFLIRYHNGTTYVVLPLAPGPTEVEYPTGHDFTEHISKDHAVVLQRPLRDSRKRQWVWKNYYSGVPNFENQWNTFLSLDTKQRIADNKEPTVFVWEDDSEGENPFNQLTDSNPPDLSAYTNLDWVEVKIVNVYRKTRKGGGPTRFEDAVVEFYVVDPAWEGM